MPLPLPPLPSARPAPDSPEAARPDSPEAAELDAPQQLGEAAPLVEDLQRQLQEERHNMAALLGAPLSPVCAYWVRIRLAPCALVVVADSHADCARHSAVKVEQFLWAGSMAQTPRSSPLWKLQPAPTASAARQARSHCLQCSRRPAGSLFHASVMHAGKLQRMEQERRSFVDEVSELRPRLEESEARVLALQEELKRCQSQAAAAAASADQRIQVLFQYGTLWKQAQYGGAKALSPWKVGLVYAAAAPACRAALLKNCTCRMRRQGCACCSLYCPSQQGDLELFFSAGTSRTGTRSLVNMLAEPASKPARHAARPAALSHGSRFAQICPDPFLTPSHSGALQLEKHATISMGAMGPDLPRSAQTHT